MINVHINNQQGYMSDVSENLAKTGKWHVNTAWLFERAGYKCEYCDLDFLGSVANYKSFQIDHIIPLSKGGEDINDNKAVSCKTCNWDLKSRWNPAVVCDSRDRSVLVDTVRQHVKERERFYLDEMQTMKDIVNGRIQN